MKSRTGWLMSLLLGFVMATLVGCAGLTPQTFDDKVAIGSTTITTVTSEANTLAAAGKITKATAQNVLAASRTASTALTEASRLQGTGDTTGSAAQLAMASSILDGLKAFLVTQGAPSK